MTTTFAENRRFLASLGHNLFRLLVAVGDVSQSLTSLSAVSLQTLCSLNTEANTQHYRKDCASNKFSQKKCDELKATTIKDTRVWRHLETVKENTNIVLQNITLN